MTQQLLPPGAEFRGGRVVRIERRAVGDKTREVLHPVAMTLREAKKRGWDFYDSELGWIIGGRKVANTDAHLLSPATISRAADFGFEDDEETEGGGAETGYQAFVTPAEAAMYASQ